MHANPRGSQTGSVYKNEKLHLIVRDLKEHKLPCSKRIQHFKCYCSNHGAEETTINGSDDELMGACMSKPPPHDLANRSGLVPNSSGNRLRTFGGKKYETSSKLNNVPPMGAPNATATPAAHAALRTSRRLAGHTMRTDCVCGILRTDLHCSHIY